MSTKVRAHSKFSASGAERWGECPGSVALSEGLPDKDTVWSIEGTRAHKILEEILKLALEMRAKRVYYPSYPKHVPREMIVHATNAANFILEQGAQAKGSEIFVETRIHLPFIHPEMFGTFDGAVVDHFGTLHVFDFKYGKTVVNPKANLQMLFYGIGLAHRYDWNFKRVRLWIIQPRIRGYDGPVFWDISINELKNYVRVFKRMVKRVLENPTEYNEGPWCHFCKAKSRCPLKNEGRVEKAKAVFASTPVTQSKNEKKVKNGKDR